MIARPGERRLNANTPLGVKGSPVQIRPSRPLLSRSEGVSDLGPGPLFDLREPDGEPPGWCFLVPLRDGLSRSGPLLAEDLVHGRGAGGERGPDLVPVDGLGDGCAAVADQVADVLDADAVGAEDGHERVP